MYLLLTATFLFCGVTLAEDSKPEVDKNGIFVLNMYTFNTAISNNKLMTVLFYMPKGEESEKVTPVYAKTAKKLKKDKSQVKLAKVDASLQLGLVINNEVKKYPTLVYFKDGKRSHNAYANKTESEMIAWINNPVSDP